MSTVEDVVRSTIQDFVRDGVLFTALDVSNKVKETLPLTRHREVRELVRAAFATDIEPASYARTPITVKLDDGTTAEALLYHPLADSWDLDAKYDDQKRAQTANRPTASVQTLQAVAAVIANPANLSAPISNLSSLLTPAPKVVTVPPALTKAAPPTVSSAVTSSRALWDSLFQNQPSLFPRH
jgi:hypothetical protein